MLLTILNYLLLFCCPFTVVHNNFHCLPLQSFAKYNTTLRTSFAYKSLYHDTTFSHAIFKGISKFLKIKCLLRLNLFTDITQTCVHRTLANCRAKPGIFASILTNSGFFYIDRELTREILFVYNETFWFWAVE